MRRLTIAALALATTLASAQTFDGSLIVRPNWQYAQTGLVNRAVIVSDMFTWAHTNGSGTNAMERMYAASHSVVSTQSVTINVQGGISDPFGNVLYLDKIKVLAVRSTSLANPTVSMSWLSITNSIRPGGFLLFVAPSLGGIGVGTSSNIVFSSTSTNTTVIDVWIGGIVGIVPPQL